MRICIYNGLDINGLGQRMSRYFNTCTKHKATNVVAQQTYLGYEADVILKKGQQMNWEAAAKEWDFFIIRWPPGNIGQQTFYLAQLVQKGILTQSNCIIKISGSEVRYNPWDWYGFQNFTGITIVTNGYDYTLNNRLGFTVQHIPHMVDVEVIERRQARVKQRSDGKFWIAHAPTDTAKKGTKYLLAAVAALKSRGYAVDVDLIQGKPWKETLDAKAACHGLYDQISGDVGIGAFGMNLIEGLAQGKICFGGFNKYVYSFYPELLDDGLVMQCTKDNIADVIVQALKRHGTNHVNEKGMEFVKRNFDMKLVGKKWQMLVEYIAEGGL